LPKGFHRIRHYGLLANGNRVANIAKARELLAVPAGCEQPDTPEAFTVALQDPANNDGFEVYVTPYSGTQVTEQEFKLDEPSGVDNQPTHVAVDGVPATMFYGSNSVMGDTREIWFIHGGFLYEVTTYKELDSWLAPIMQTWRFTP
jgi:hypothetical protein